MKTAVFPVNLIFQAESPTHFPLIIESFNRLSAKDKGILNRTIVHPRDVFKKAILQDSVSIIAAHNHPSGNVQPSLEDKEITERLSQAGEVVGIHLLDHIIFCKNDYYSFLEHGTL